MPKWMDSARDFLGLGEDPYYDDEYDVVESDEDPYEARKDPPEPTRSGMRRPADPDVAPREEGDGGVRMIRDEPEQVSLVHPPAEPSENREPRETRNRPNVSAVAPAHAGGDRGVVRPLPTTNKPEVVSPTRFDDVQAVADAFKKVQPVIINLGGVDRDLSRRLIDFASGLCYGLEGDMERVAEQVFLLTPRGAEVSDDDRRRLAEGHLNEYDNR